MEKAIEYTLLDGSTAILLENDKGKILLNDNYKFVFNKKTGFFVRSGKTKTDDPDPILGLPEIADIEISTSCSEGCKFCYKANIKNGEYMSLKTFKIVFSKLPKTVTQIAFGIGDINSNPDMWKIFDYCNKNGVIPNVTVNGKGITDEIADKLVSKCGAVAVSLYDKDSTYNTIKLLTDKGLNQVNIHFMLANETLEKAYEVIKDIKTDSRLKKLKAIVFLSLKKKGRAEKQFNNLSQDKFEEFMNILLSKNIPFGFDSCSAQKFIKTIKNHKEEKYKQLEVFAEPCESSLFSSYINVKGEYFPCSFMEGTKDWEKGLSVVECEDFIEDIWNSEINKIFKHKVIDCRNNCKSCPVYDI